MIIEYLDGDTLLAHDTRTSLTVSAGKIRRAEDANSFTSGVSPQGALIASFDRAASEGYYELGYSYSVRSDSEGEACTSLTTARTQYPDGVEIANAGQWAAFSFATCIIQIVELEETSDPLPYKTNMLAYSDSGATLSTSNDTPMFAQTYFDNVGSILFEDGSERAFTFDPFSRMACVSTPLLTGDMSAALTFSVPISPAILVAWPFLTLAEGLAACACGSAVAGYIAKQCAGFGPIKVMSTCQYYWLGPDPEVDEPRFVTSTKLRSTIISNSAVVAEWLREVDGMTLGYESVVVSVRLADDNSYTYSMLGAPVALAEALVNIPYISQHIAVEPIKFWAGLQLSEQS